MITLLTFIRPPLPSVDMGGMEMMVRHLKRIKDERNPYIWYSLKKDDPTYWKDWDGKHIVVRLKRGYSPDEVFRGFAYRKSKGTPSYILSLPPEKRNATYAKELINSLLSHPGVLFAEPLLLYHSLYWPNDPYFGSQLWGMWAIYADKAWDITWGNSSVKVCVVDEGVDYNHEDISGNYAGGYDYVEGDNDPYPADPNELHGTHVAGIIAAVMNNAKGVAGVAQVGILSCRALASGSGTSTDIASCIRWCASNGAKVINMSLGSASPASEIQDAIVYATDSVSGGTVIVAASGNDGVNGVYYPAAYPEVIAVGAIDTLGQRAYFSNYGQELELVAPGSMILSTVPFLNSYAYADGTSMAAPHVSGVAALIYSKNPNLSADTVRAILDATAIDMGEYGKDYFYGYGLVNAYLALLATPSPTVTSYSSGARVELKGRRLYATFSKPLYLYSLGGRLLAYGNRIDITLKGGVYFLKEENGGVHKLVVR